MKKKLTFTLCILLVCGIFAGCQAGVKKVYGLESLTDENVVAVSANSESNINTASSEKSAAHKTTVQTSEKDAAANDESKADTKTNTDSSKTDKPETNDAKSTKTENTSSQTTKSEKTNTNSDKTTTESTTDNSKNTAVEDKTQNTVSEYPMEQCVLNFEINGENLFMPLEGDNRYFDAVTLNSEKEVSFLLKNDIGATVKINGEAIEMGKETKISIDKIAYNKNIEVTVEAKNNSKTMYIRTLSSKIPAFDFTAGDYSKGEYYLSVQGDASVILKTDEKGNILYYNTCESGRICDFKKHTADDKIYYSYHKEDVSWGGIADNSYFPGERIVMDEDYNIIDNVYLGEGKFVSEGDPINAGCFDIISEGEYIISGSYNKKVYDIEESLMPNSKGVNVVGNTIQIVKKGKVTFEFNSTEDKGLYGLCANADYSSAAVQDYIHISSVQRISDGVIICCENANCVIKINDKGETDWILGGNGDTLSLKDDEKPVSTASAYEDEKGNIIVFDKGNGEKASAVIKYTVDEKKNTAVAEKFETEISAGEYSGTVPVKENIYSVRFGEKQEGQTGEDAWLVNFGQNKVLTGLSVSDKNYISEFYMYE